jgi:hypothetical protein
MGFNAQSHSSGGRVDYYFYGYSDYSEALVNDNFIELSTGKPGTFYPNGNVRHGFFPYDYRRYNGQNNSIGYEYDIPTQGPFGYEHKFENGKLVYWAWTDPRKPISFSNRIEHNSQNIIIYFDSGSYYRYYNIPRTELLDIFLKKYVEMICEINELINGNKSSSQLGGRFNEYFFDEFVSALLSGRTSRELAIFRNCLYAIKGYKFSNSSWTDFFNKYLVGYTAKYSNAEVTAMFDNNEKRLLDLIIQYESRR